MIMDPLHECEEEECSSQNSMISSCASDSEQEENTSVIFEKGVLEEKEQTENKIGKYNEPVRSSHRVSSSRFFEEYDQLPANAEDRHKFFIQEYKKLLRDISAQTSLVKELIKNLNQELNSSKNKKTIAQLKSLVRSENDKISGLVVKALRIQRKYPAESWDPIPSHKEIEKAVRKILDENISPSRKSNQINLQNSKQSIISSASGLNFSGNLSSICSMTVKSSEKIKYPLPNKNKSSDSREWLEKIPVPAPRHQSSTIAHQKITTSNDNGVKKKYSELLDILRHKENELQKILDVMEKRLQTSVESKTPKTPTRNLSQSNLKYLQRKVSALQLEQKEFRKQIKEQQDALTKYQKKIITQKKAISTLEVNNKLVEYDINTVICKLKENYESKLKDLSKYPKLLQAEKTKLETVTKDKKELEAKFQLLSKEYKSVKEKLDEKSKRTSVTNLEKVKSLQRELKVFKNFNSTLREESARLTNELHQCKVQLDSFRNESNKLLFRTKDQADSQRRLFERKINELKSDLLSNRASNTCFLKQRDKVIGEMQSQLNTLSDNFELSQKHIEMLRKHMSTLSTKGK